VPEVLRFTVPSRATVERLDKALARLMVDRSRATIQRWIQEGRVRVGGVACRVRDTVQPGMIIEVEPGPAPVSRATPDASVPIDCVHEDEHLIVVNKPAGLVVHPARSHPGGTLVNGLLARSGFRVTADPNDPDGALRPGVVHRIDKDTSGLLVVAKDEATREGLKHQLSERRVCRHYLALSLGIPKAGRIQTPYGRHPTQRLKFSSRVREGKLAVTHVQIDETFSRRAAQLSCRLETGRTHQIRVHLSEQARTPLLGDVLYGGAHPVDPDLRSIAEQLGRQALHAASLGFVHPITGSELSFEAPLPPDMQAALESLRQLG